MATQRAVRWDTLRRYRLLALIEAEPRHGRALVAATADRSEAAVYNTLRNLVRHGLVSVEPYRAGRKVYRLTERGAGLLAEAREALAVPRGTV